MPRLARIVIPNVPYHITQRGNHRQDVFYTPDHYRQYLEYIAQYSSRYRFDILAYCLMSNHIHLVGIPRKQDSMARMIQATHSRHTQNVNRNMGFHGHLWHSRFYSTALDDLHLWNCFKYVEQNPVRAGILTKAQEYVWSSAASHCRLRDDPVLTFDPRINEMFDGWSKTLKVQPEKEIIERIRNRTMTGVPCGDERFRRRISRLAGKKLIDRPRGRPFKSDK